MERLNSETFWISSARGLSHDEVLLMNVAEVNQLMIYESNKMKAEKEAVDKAQENG